MGLAAKLFLLAQNVIWSQSIKITRRVVDAKMVSKLCEEQGIETFMETSAKEGINTKKVFKMAAIILAKQAEDFEFEEKEKREKSEKMKLAMGKKSSSQGCC